MEIILILNHTKPIGNIVNKKLYDYKKAMKRRVTYQEFVESPWVVKKDNKR